MPETSLPVPLQDGDGACELRPEGRARTRVEEAMSESQQRYESLVQAIDGIVWEIDAETFNFTFVSNQAESILGYPVEQWLSEPNFWVNRMHPDDRRWAVDYCVDATKRREDHRLEYRMIAADGRAVWLSDVVTVRVADDGKVRLRGVMVDITERRQTEEALRANEAVLRDFIKHAPASIAMFDTQMRYLQTSDRWLIDYRLEGQNIIGKSHYDVFPDLPERWKEVHARVLGGSVECCDEDPRLFADGTLEWLQWEAIPWRKGGGEIGGIILFTQVITGRKLAEERINFLQMITMDVAAAHDLPSALNVVLRHICEKTGWSLGQAWIPQRDGAALECCLAWSAAAPSLKDFEAFSKKITMPPGIGLPGRVWASRQPFWVRDVTLDSNFPRAEAAIKSGLKAALGVPILSGDGVIAVLEFYLCEPREEDERLVKLIAAVAAQIGLVCARKLAEEKLRWSEQRLRLILDSAAEGIFGVDLEGRCTFCNAASLRLLGYDHPSDFLGKDMHALIAHTYRDGTPYPKSECRIVQSLLKGTSAYGSDDVFLRKDASNFPVEYWSYPMFREDHHIGAVVTFIDITERRRAEEQNRKLIHDLGERVKELTALHHAARILQSEGKSVAELLQEIVSLLPPAWQYPEVTAARISFDEMEFKTQNFSETEWSQAASFTAGALNGVVEVVYIEERPKEDIGPFLSEEQNLIDSLAEMLSSALKLKASREQLRALSESLRKAKEEEGIRIARELHDELGAALTSLKWSLMRLDKDCPESKNTRARIAEMVGLVDATINTVRRISSELRPGVLDDLGLISAIEWHIDQFQANAGIICRFDSQIENVDLNREQAVTVFRIFQEAMTNILRHAGASKVNILIEEEEGEFVLEVSDNGRGITESEKLGTRSLGLLGMRERAHSMGGKVEISAAAGKGTTLIVRLPHHSK